MEPSLPELIQNIAVSDDRPVLRFHDHGMGEFNARHRIGPCVWPHFDLLAIHAGRVEIELLRRDRIELSAAQAVLIYPHTHFSGDSLVPLSRASIQHFSISRPNDAASLPLPLRRLADCRSGYSLYRRLNKSTLADIYRAVKVARDPSSPLSHAMRESLLLLILSQLLAGSSPRPGRPPVGTDTTNFEPLLHWLSTRLHNPPELEEMARFMQCSPSHFRATFAQTMGDPPARFLRRLRHMEATRLLRETSLPIKSIARKLGYDDLAHFYRFFATLTSYTPTQYRDRHRVRG
jgi:AraC-like DNA-binding protein